MEFLLIVLRTIFILIALELIIIPLCKVVWRIWQVRRQFVKVQREMNEQFGKTFTQQQPDQPEPKKKIDPNMGEYVSFEEIAHDPSTQPQSDRPKSADSAHKSSPRIEDADWEDIK